LTAFANSVAERFVLSIKSECLSKLALLGENHLRRAYIEHYHRERNHQGVGNRCSRQANRRCDRPTGMCRSCAASGWADCSTSTIGPPHEFVRLLAHDDIARATQPTSWRMMENAIRSSVQQLTPGFITVTGVAAIEACREAHKAPAERSRCIADAVKLSNLTSARH